METKNIERNEIVKEKKAVYYDFCFKVIIIGQSSTGKSCLLKQFVEGIFDGNSASTVGVEFSAKIMEVGSEGQHCKLHIWDMAGTERFKSTNRSYYRKSAAALIVYDITSMDSFKDVPYWLNEARTRGNDNILCVLVGNKKDLEDQREVPFLMGSEYAQSENIHFYESSAKSGYNISDIFARVAKELVVQMNKNRVSLSSSLEGSLPLDMQNDILQLQQQNNQGYCSSCK